MRSRTRYFVTGCDICVDLPRGATSEGTQSVYMEIIHWLFSILVWVFCRLSQVVEVSRKWIAPSGVAGLIYKNPGIEARFEVQRPHRSQYPWLWEIETLLPAE